MSRRTSDRAVGHGAKAFATPWRGFLLIFLLHVGLHGFFLTLLDARHVAPHTRFEVTAVAMTLYEKGTFADPYGLPTGPTAHMPPFHPALFAGIYHLLGPTLAAGYVTWLVLIACHGAMWGMLPWLAVRLGLSTGAGLLAGVAGALLPRWSGYVEAPSAIAIGLMLVAFLGRWEGLRPTRSGSSSSGSGRSTTPWPRSGSASSLSSPPRGPGERSPFSRPTGGRRSSSRSSSTRSSTTSSASRRVTGSPWTGSRFSSRRARSSRREQMPRHGRPERGVGVLSALPLAAFR